jgi:hypothetical protein
MSSKSHQTAADIIHDVGKACGVSQKALIVLLQKEQGLVTDTWPWDIQYKKATGYGCPDTAPCDSEYYGFFNQVYMAARQFKKYARDPDNYNYQGGVTSFVQYNPSSSCGGKNVSMQNQATAGLYNYTPYVPNKAALDNLYGTGNSCSAYGNRNFWRYYNDWFGSPTYKGKVSSLTGDWNGALATDVGLKVDRFLLDQNKDGTPDLDFAFGKSTDTPIIGDWDDDSSDEVGVRRGNVFYFDYDNSGGSADVSFAFGKSTDKAFTGDFNGDGKDDIAIKRGNRFYLNYDNGSSADVSFAFGRSSDSPIVGDWDNDGKDEIGIRRGNMFYLKYGLSDGSADASFAFGKSSDKAFVGDFNGDGQDDIGLRRANVYYLDYGNNGHKTDLKYSFGRSTDSLLVGDWNHDGTDKIGVRRNNQFYLDYNGTGGGAENSFFLSY